MSDHCPLLARFTVGTCIPVDTVATVHLHTTAAGNECKDPNTSAFVGDDGFPAVDDGHQEDDELALAIALSLELNSKPRNVET